MCPHQNQMRTFHSFWNYQDTVNGQGSITFNHLQMSYPVYCQEFSKINKCISISEIPFLWWSRLSGLDISWNQHTWTHGNHFRGKKKILQNSVEDACGMSASRTSQCLIFSFSVIPAGNKIALHIVSNYLLTISDLCRKWLETYDHKYTNSLK